MNTRPRISGIHHITAVASSAAGNLVFYEHVLGLRLVKRTVNFDDPYTYHFYFGDAQGSPGTILTFFPWERLPQGHPGAGMVTATSFCAAPASMDFWVQRLSSFGIDSAVGERLGDPVVRFSDPHGLSLEIVGTDEMSSTNHWRSGPVESRHALRGFHSATALVNDLNGIKALLTDGMGLNVMAREGNRIRFQMQGRGPGRYFDVVQDPDAPQGKPGGGTVHHIAFRARDGADQLQWQALLRGRGIAVTDVRDRNYFRSIYYRTPGGILFEIATDPPGFTVDEPVARLGKTLMLPAQYEPLRTDISQRLPALREEMFRHIYEPAGTASDDGGTLVTLHGTGGSERDLLHLAKEVGGGMAVISPRGKVLENKMPRFFKRLVNNVPDENDIRRRVQELSGFLIDSAERYGRDPDQLTALGYSNGANMAAAVLLLRPEIFSNAVLLRPMRPLSRTAIADLRGKSILVLRGAHDRIIPPESTDELIGLLGQSGADVTTHVIDAGHEMTRDDIDQMTRWLGGLSTGQTHKTKATQMTQPA